MFMCVDGAEIGSVNLLMAGSREGTDIIPARPWLSGGVCTPHSLDLELEEIAKLPFIATHLAEAKRIVKFIREHHYLLLAVAVARARAVRAAQRSTRTTRASPPTSSRTTACTNNVRQLMSMRLTGGTCSGSPARSRASGKVSRARPCDRARCCHDVD